MPHPGGVLLLAPLVVVGPLLLLVEAVVTLARLGPAGWVAGAALVLAVLWTSRWTWRRTRRWWAGTRVESRAPSSPRPVPPVRPGTAPARVVRSGSADVGRRS